MPSSRPNEDHNNLTRANNHLFGKGDFPIRLLLFFDSLERMSGDKYLIVDQQGCYFVTFTVVHWIDIFTRTVYRDIVVDALNFCIANKGLVVFGWVIMSNHVHAILATQKDGGSISAIIRDFKKFTSREIVSTIRSVGESRREWMLRAFAREATRTGRAKHYKLWKDDNHAIYIDNILIRMETRLNYIHQNPVKNGLVDHAWEYVYSSARDYETGKKGLVNIKLEG